MPRDTPLPGLEYLSRAISYPLHTSSKEQSGSSKTLKGILKNMRQRRGYTHVCSKHERKVLAIYFYQGNPKWNLALF